MGKLKIGDVVVVKVCSVWKVKVVKVLKNRYVGRIEGSTITCDFTADTIVEVLK